MQRTISLTLSKYSELCDTIKVYNTIVNTHIATALSQRTLSKVKLHHLLYKDLRAKYPEFPSALIQCARDNAVEMLKSNKMKSTTKKRLDSSVRFDLRTARVLLESGALQLTTTAGRKKYAVKVPGHFQKYFSWEVKSVTLGIEKKHLKLKIIVDGVLPEQSRSGEVLGIDLGLKNYAAFSEGQLIKSKEINRVKRKYAHLRGELQSKGTRVAKCKLKVLSGRERRFTLQFTHSLG